MRNVYLVNDELIVANVTKAKDGVMDYVLDYTKFLSRLGSDTIASSSWTEDSGNITIDSDTNTTLKATVWQQARTGTSIK